MRKLEKYLNNRFETIYLLLEKPKREYTPLVFHKLRVEIKKLKASFELLEACSENFKRKKPFKLFRHIFKLAGIVREIHIEETTLKKYFDKNLLKTYKTILQKNKKRSRDDFFSLVNESTLSHLKKSYLKVLPFAVKMNKSETKKYMDKMLKKIKEVLDHKNLHIADIHKLRKYLKKYFYDRKSMGMDDPIKPYPKTVELMEALGIWHDCQVIIEKLKQTKRSGLIKAKETIELDKIITALASDKKTFLKNIKKAIPASELFEAPLAG